MQMKMKEKKKEKKNQEKEKIKKKKRKGYNNYILPLVVTTGEGSDGWQRRRGNPGKGEPPSALSPLDHPNPPPRPVP